MSRINKNYKCLKLERQIAWHLRKHIKNPEIENWKDNSKVTTKVNCASVKDLTAQVVRHKWVPQTSNNSTRTIAYGIQNLYPYSWAVWTVVQYYKGTKVNEILKDLLMLKQTPKCFKNFVLSEFPNLDLNLQHQLIKIVLILSWKCALPAPFFLKKIDYTNENHWRRLH